MDEQKRGGLYDGFYCLKLHPSGEVILEADNDVDALRLMAEGWTRQQVSSLFHYTGPTTARAQRRLWPTPPPM